MRAQPAVDAGEWIATAFVGPTATRAAGAAGALERLFASRAEGAAAGAS